MSEVFQKAIVKIDVASASDVLGLNVTAASHADECEQGFAFTPPRTANSVIAMIETKTRC